MHIIFENVFGIDYIIIIISRIEASVIHHIYKKISA